MSNTCSWSAINLLASSEAIRSFCVILLSSLALFSLINSILSSMASLLTVASRLSVNDITAGVLSAESMGSVFIAYGCSSLAISSLRIPSSLNGLNGNNSVASSSNKYSFVMFIFVGSSSSSSESPPAGDTDLFSFFFKLLIKSGVDRLSPLLLYTKSAVSPSLLPLRLPMETEPADNGPDVTMWVPA